MSKRPILSLKRKPESMPPQEEATDTTSLEPQKLDPDTYRAEQKKKAHAERVKRQNDILNHLNQMNLKYPLSKGTGVTIITSLREKGFSHKLARWAMAWWVGREEYLNAVVEGEFRFNLDGSEAELIAESEKEHSRIRLDKIQKKKQIKKSD
ncbi:ProQ/FINO family protein [Vibrio sp. 10N.261.46.A3]|uniref:ProQ/FINO family protein n=2 Tax=unclassified Vibrio TaxID=2614977 RepID=UPI00355062D3